MRFLVFVSALSQLLSGCLAATNVPGNVSANISTNATWWVTNAASVAASRAYVDARTELKPVTEGGALVGYTIGLNTNVVASRGYVDSKVVEGEPGNYSVVSNNAMNAVIKDDFGDFFHEYLYDGAGVDEFGDWLPIELDIIDENTPRYYRINQPFYLTNGTVNIYIPVGYGNRFSVIEGNGCDFTIGNGWIGIHGYVHVPYDPDQDQLWDLRNLQEMYLPIGATIGTGDNVIGASRLSAAAASATNYTDAVSELLRSKVDLAVYTFAPWHYGEFAEEYAWNPSDGRWETQAGDWLAFSGGRWEWYETATEESIYYDAPEDALTLGVGDFTRERIYSPVSPADTLAKSSEIPYALAQGVTNLNRSVQYVQAQSGTVQFKVPDSVASGSSGSSGSSVSHGSEWIVCVYASGTSDVPVELPPGTWWIPDASCTNAVAAGSRAAFRFTQVAERVYMVERREFSAVTVGSANP